MKGTKKLAWVTLFTMLGACAWTSTASANFAADATFVALKRTTIKDYEFTVTNQKVTCKKVILNGQVTALATNETTYTDTYEECTTAGLTTTVNTSGCHTVISRTTPRRRVTGCTNGGITVSVSIPFVAKCHILIPNGQEQTGISYTNGEGDFIVSINESNTKVEVKESTGACPLTVGTHTNATYSEEFTLQAEGASIWVL